MADFQKIFEDIRDVRVIEAPANSKYISFDLSVTNPALTNIEISDPDALDAYIHYFLAKNKATIAYGGYLEPRDLYDSPIFHDGLNQRNIHLGVDIWVKAGTPVLAALDGVVHSFDYNTGTGNYGPTIILEHRIDAEKFHTLYGHLSLESISDLEIGQKFGKGAKIGTVGKPEVNGDYAPHLHFQIIHDIGDHFGDYPGVCSREDLKFYLNNCPDPDPLLKINWWR